MVMMKVSKKLWVILMAFTLALSVFLGVCSAASDSSKPYDIAVIIKATNSDFWQYVLVGARNYMAENPTVVKITTDGPPAETDIDQQVSLLEQIIERQPDAIVISPSSTDALVAGIEKATKAGIPVITIDNLANTDVAVSHLATNNLKAGGQAADEFIRHLKLAGKEPKGKVGIISALAGAQVIQDRDEGFVTRMKEIAPDIVLLPIQYVDNDMIKAMDVATSQMDANPDLVGFFADNNMTGDGVARAVIEKNRDKDLVVLAFDSDPEEIKGLESGAINALVLQDPYGMGYKGVDTAVKHLDGEKVEKLVDTGITIVTKENMKDKEIQGLLDPMTRKID
jgi:ribose transport system substrate-binding protein